MNKIKVNEIVHCDCLEGLRKLPDKCIDLIITSPPYNLGNSHHTGNKRHKSYDDNMDEEEYQRWQIEVLNECHRVLRDEGSMIYNHKNRIKSGTQITPYQWILKTNFLVKQEIVWINRSQNFDKIRFYPFTERLYWLSKKKDTTLINVLSHHDVFDWKEWEVVGIKGEHTRAFPLKMVKDILLVFPDAKLVLDPFMGSGTTAFACKLLKRDFIGFEINPKFIGVAMSRINDFEKEKDPSLFSFK